METRAARTVFVILGVIALIVGLVWIGQGMGLIPGSFMTGDRTWFVIGLIVAVVGVVLLVLGFRRPGRGRR